MLGDEFMAYNVTFMVDRKAIASNDIAPIFDSFKWWEDLAKKALEYANEFEMRLWEDDFEGIKSGQKFGKRVSNKQTMEIVFQGKLNDKFKHEILNNYLTCEGYIKWFTLSLKKDNEDIFWSAHYGDETYISVDTRDQVDAIRKWAENYPIIWRVDVFEVE